MPPQGDLHTVLPTTYTPLSKNPGQTSTRSLSSKRQASTGTTYSLPSKRKTSTTSTTSTRSPPPKPTGQLMICDPNGRNKILEVCSSEDELQSVTVEQLKTTVLQEMKLAGNIRMVYDTNTLEEPFTLGQYGIRRLCMIQSVFLLPGGSRGPHGGTTGPHS